MTVMIMKWLLFSGRGGATTAGDLGLLVLRLTGLMLALGHGLEKIPPPPIFLTDVEKMGLPAPHAFAWLAALCEFAGGVLMAVGLFTRLGAVMVIAVMLTALTKVHLHDPTFMSNQGAAKEPALLYLLPAVALLFTGSGRFGIDAVLRRRGAEPSITAGM